MAGAPEAGKGVAENRIGKAARLKDVAQAAGVDISTVSRVLNSDERVSIRPVTRQRVIEAAAALDYRPHAAARSLKTARALAIGLLVPDLFNVAHAAIATGAQERALAAGYTLVIATGPISERVRMLEGRIDGLLIASATTDTPLLPDVGGQLPTVLVNRRAPGGIPSVTAQDEAGAALATDYLVALGHTRIAHVAGPQNTDTAVRRRHGYLSKMEEHGLEVPREWIAEGSFSERGGYTAATRLLRLEPRPTALFVTNLTAAIGAMAAARKLGLRIPEDLSIVGFDDVELAMYLDPPLTTVRMPLSELGSEGVESIIALIEGGKVNDVQVGIAPELVVRGSAAAPPAHADEP